MLLQTLSAWFFSQNAAGGPLTQGLVPAIEADAPPGPGEFHTQLGSGIAWPEGQMLHAPEPALSSTTKMSSSRALLRPSQPPSKQLNSPSS